MTIRCMHFIAVAATLTTIACASSSAKDSPADANQAPDASVEPDAAQGSGFGDECTDRRDCASDICYQPDGTDAPGICTEECEGDCPDGFACKVVMVADFTDRRICVPADETTCDNCTANVDCGDTSDFCVELTGGFFCTIDCAGNPSICPVGFTCQQVAGTGDTIVGMQCMPTNGICCVDADGDQRGAGDGCITTDCDDGNDAVYDDAAEVCDGFDNDCIGGIDVDPGDCAVAECKLGAFGYFDRAPEPCESGSCTVQDANMCGLYTCADGGESGDTCATACDVEDNAKCIPTAHCDASLCLDDLADGQAADEDSDCVSDHEQNGFCCAFGDCCQMASDCPTFGTVAPICDNETTCQGTRGEAICGANFICSSTGLVQDDSACAATTLASDCGFYSDIFCTGAADQTAPVCPTSCASDAECDANGYCNAAGQCVQDESDGGTCDDVDGQGDAECQNDHCQNGFCCTSAAGTDDCCQSETDCPASYSSPPVCTVASGCQGVADVAQCASNVCSTSTGVDDDSACDSGTLANDCGPYLPIFCDGNSVQNQPTCPGSCTSDLDCDTNAYCSLAGACVPDQPDGGACFDGDGRGDSECQAAHCQNGFCCAGNGDCCADNNDCSTYGQASICDDATTCQGTRVDGICNGSNTCVSQNADDDSGCNALESNDCGPYPSVACSNAADQMTPACATSCTVDGDCDPSAHCDGAACVPDLGTGGFCDEQSDCGGGLVCVDSVCCTTACNSGCEACDLPGSEGTCTVISDGQDPDNECGAIDCSGFFSGYVGDTCYQRADVSAATATCNGAGSCRSAAQECSASGQGAAANTCDSFCQDPTAGTCSGTTAGSCTNVSQGSATCGNGVCQVTEPRCIGGVPNNCTPNAGASTAETCNNIDDNCDGSIDNGSFGDSLEPDNSCSAVRTLSTVGSGGSSVTYNTLTIYGAGDNDYYRIPATETDNSCSCCDFFCLDEDFQLTVTLTVPVGAGSYFFCTGSTCGGVNDNCVEILAGQSNSWVWTLDGACPGDDNYDRYFRVYGDNAPGFECLPYTLSYNFVAGCF